LVGWAKRRLVAKNRLKPEDAAAVDAACRAVAAPLLELTELDVTPDGATQVPVPPGLTEARCPRHVNPIPKTTRIRNKAHLMFVASHPCVVCLRTQCDAHDLKFAQPRALGRKVSDEYTVPLCREHHRDLHRYGKKTGWRANVGIDLPIARDLREKTSFTEKEPLPHHLPCP
jgi:hypothetical protein